jgi:hypothetical protein
MLEILVGIVVLTLVLLSVTSEHLKGVHAKIMRAEEHLRLLNQGIPRYLQERRERTQLPTKIHSQGNRIRLTFDPPEASRYSRHRNVLSRLVPAPVRR